MNEWKEYKFGDLIKSMQLGTSAIGSEENYGIPLLKMGNLTIGGFDFSKLEKLQISVEQEFSSYILKKGDFLFNTRNTLELVGKSAVWKDQLPIATFNSNIMRIKFIDGIDNFYLGYYFANQDGWSEFKRISIGTTSVAAIYSKDLIRCRVKIPTSISTQRKIARILSTVDAVIENTEAAIAKYKALKQGMLHDLFTRGIDLSTGKLRPKPEEATELYRESILGPIPKEWEVGSFSDLFELNPSTSLKNLESEDEVSFIKMDAVSNEANLQYQEYKSLKELTGKGFTIFQNGDILFAKITPCMENGKGAFVQNLKNGIGFGSTEFHVFRPIKKESILFVFFYSIEQNFRINAESQMTGSAGQKRVSPYFFDEKLIGIPSLAEQEKIGLIARATEDKLIKESSYLSKIISIKQGLMSDLLTGKKEVQAEEKVNALANGL